MSEEPAQQPQDATPPLRPTAETRESLAVKLAPVVVGALLGVLPVLTNSYLESRATVRQQRIDRRLTTLREFSLACNRTVYAIEQIAILQWATVGMLQDEPAAPSTKGQPTTDEGPSAAVVQNLLKAQNDLFASQAELDAQHDIAQALFGVELRQPYIGAGPTPADLQNPDEYLQRQMSEQMTLARSNDAKAFAQATEKRALDILRSQQEWVKYCSESTKTLAGEVLR